MGCLPFGGPHFDESDLLFDVVDHLVRVVQIVPVTEVLLGLLDLPVQEVVLFLVKHLRLALVLHLLVELHLLLLPLLVQQALGNLH